MRISDWSSDVCSCVLRGAVGGCSDDPSACGVLLIHGDREQADMIHDRVWRLAIAEPVGVELLAKSPGAALHVEATRKHAFGPHSAIDTVHHHLDRSEEHTSELQSLMRISYAIFCLK